MKFLLSFLFIIVGISFSPQDAAAQLPAPVDLAGYAWSSNIGWVSFDGPGYGVTIQTNGNLSGFAWSSNIGWVSFNETSGCPAGTCQPRVDFANNELLGWARVCSVTVNSDCTGALSSDAGGWDGWISFNCANSGGCATNNYKVSTLAGSFANYAWGGDVMGWLKLNPALGVTFTPPCVGAVACSVDLASRDVTDQWCVVTNIACPLGRQCDISNPAGSCVAADVAASVTATPRRVRSGGTTQVSWSATNATACDLVQSNPGGASLQSWSGTTGTNQTSAALTGLTVFRLSCSDIDGLNYREVASSTVEVIPQLIEV